MTPNREEAYALLKEYTTEENLFKHAFAVEAVMRHFAKKMAPEEEERWAVLGLMHDIDYEQYSDEHCYKVEEILGKRNWPKEDIRAIMSHGYKLVNDVEPILPEEKVLYAVDQLTGLIVATALVRPSKSILDMKTSSVRKKFKDKGFAASISRETIEDGAERLGLDLSELITETLTGMKTVAEEIGLGA